MRTFRTLLVLLVLTPFVPPVFRRAATSAQPPMPPGESERTEKPAFARQLQGTMSCSASVCHGGTNLGRPLSEATTWRALDPHARAYDTLLTPASSAIAKRVWGESTRADEAPLCLKCHVDPRYDQAGTNFRRHDGVGCESCHGAAEDWLRPHYRQAAWSRLSWPDKHAKGLADTKSLPGRAGTCVPCHVGTATAAVDHDLIAAGHPALRFEFASYFANLPPHWNVHKDKQKNSTRPGHGIDFEARAWAIGQLVSAAAALDLLAQRAAPEANRPWPELAELDCFSCHHDLKAASWRQHSQHLGQRRPGTLLWSNWYYALLPDLLADTQKSTTAAAGKSSTAVRQFLQHRDMNRIPFTKEGRDTLAKQAHDLAKTLRAKAADSVEEVTAIGALKQQLSNSQALDGTWDGAAQQYLALLALRQMDTDNKQPKSAGLERFIRELRGEVTFRPGYQSPPAKDSR